MKLNLGCGPVQSAGWINVDGSNRAWLVARLPWLDRLLVTFRITPPTEFNERIVHTNLLRRFPWSDESVDAVYMGEILEHFTHEDGKGVLRECYRVLKPGGVLRIRVPDHARFWKNYVEEYEQVRQQPREQWQLAHTRWTAMFFQNLCVRRPKIWQSMGHFHKWMYDEVSLILLMESVGFHGVERSAFHQSAIPNVDEVEVRSDLIVEGIRP